MAWRGRDILTLLSDGPKLTRQIAAHFGVPSRYIKSCLNVLCRKGFIISIKGIHEITEAGQLALASGQELKSGPCNGNSVSRRKPHLRGRAWNIMRQRNFFSLDDLLTLLCDGSEHTAEANLRRYLIALTRGGYLMRMERGGGTRYRLRRERNTGPEAPAWNQVTRTLRDCNTGEVFAIGRGHAVA